MSQSHSTKGSERPPRTPRVSAAAGWAVEVLVWALLTWGVWLLSLSAIDDQDLFVAGLCGLGCGLAAAATRRVFGGRWRASKGALAPALVLPVSIVVDAAAVLAAAAVPRYRHAEIVEVDISQTGDRPRPALWRAAATTIVSASPATVVLDAEPDTGRLIVHTLRSPGPSLVARYARR